MEYDLLVVQHEFLDYGLIGPFNKIKQLESAELCMKKSRLCMIINYILQLQGAGTSEMDIRLDSSTMESQIQKVEALDKALRLWKKSFFFFPIMLLPTLERGVQ